MNYSFKLRAWVTSPNVSVCLYECKQSLSRLQRQSFVVYTLMRMHAHFSSPTNYTHRKSLPLISLATRVCGYQGLGQILKLNERMQRLQCDLAGDIRAESVLFAGRNRHFRIDTHSLGETVWLQNSVLFHTFQW